MLQLRLRLPERDGPIERAVVLAACANGPKAQLALMISKPLSKQLAAGKLIRPVAKHVGGSGGGRPDMAQAGGKDPAKLEEALDVGRTYAEGIL